MTYISLMLRLSSPLWFVLLVIDCTTPRSTQSLSPSPPGDTKICVAHVVDPPGRPAIAMISSVPTHVRVMQAFFQYPAWNRPLLTTELSVVMKVFRSGA